MNIPDFIKSLRGAADTFKAIPPTQKNIDFAALMRQAFQGQNGEAQGDPYEHEPGLAWSLMEGTNTLYDGIPGDIRVMKRVPLAGRKDSYVDGGDTNDVTVDDVVTGMVIKGMYGNGDERRQRLLNDGFNYDRVMKRVNDAYRSGKQDYYGKLTDKYGIRYRSSRGDKYAGGQQYFIPDDYIGHQY